MIIRLLGHFTVRILAYLRCRTEEAATWVVSHIQTYHQIADPCRRFYCAKQTVQPPLPMKRDFDSSHHDADQAHASQVFHNRHHSD